MSFFMTIGDEKRAGESSFGVIDPARGEVFAQAPECTREELDQAMQAADDAYRRWRLDEAKRRELLVACADKLQAAAGEIGQILSQEQGKPLGKAVAEIFGASVWFRATAGLELPVDLVQDDENLRIEVRRRPLGVVGAITPWNFPVILGVWKIAPALLAGNTVVMKPSPYTPLSTLKLGEVLSDVLPPGVLNIVSGGDRLGAWITEHPTVRKISFTGSVATGKKVAAVAANDLKRITLELGGNDAAILLPDFDVDGMAEKLFWGAFENSGQICSAVKRVYVHESQYESVIDRLGELARAVKMGPGMEEGVELGPVNNAPQFERVKDLVEDAKAAGARVVAGGHAREGKGYFFEPTVLCDIGRGVRIVDEEQFGPALPVIAYRDVDEAVEQANETMFGLSGSVWSSDVERATDVATHLECGTAWVNQHVNILPNAPFGGAKWSGMGVENGPWGLAGFVELQTVNVAKKQA